jgi:hypothetical protein
MLYLLVKLAASSEQLPPSLFLADITKHTPHSPNSFGGFSDVYKATHQGKVVAFKQLRVHQPDLHLVRNLHQPVVRFLTPSFRNFVERR